MTPEELDVRLNEIEQEQVDVHREIRNRYEEFTAIKRKTKEYAQAFVEPRFDNNCLREIELASRRLTEKCEEARILERERRKLLFPVMEGGRIRNPIPGGRA